MGELGLEGTRWAGLARTVTITAPNGRKSGGGLNTSTFVSSCQGSGPAFSDRKRGDQMQTASCFPTSQGSLHGRRTLSMLAWHDFREDATTTCLFWGRNDAGLSGSCSKSAATVLARTTLRVSLYRTHQLHPLAACLLEAQRAFCIHIPIHNSVPTSAACSSSMSSSV